MVRRLWRDLGISDAETRQELAAVEEKRGAVDAAVAIRQRLQAEQPELAMNNYNLAALTGAEPPARTPAAITRLMFDDYAGHFEQHLKHDLGYRGPEVIYATLRELGLQSDLHALDLGCGTGLVGEQVAPHAARLVGVDLSPMMLLEAQKKGLYDELACDRPGRAGAAYDLVAAGDVFVYVGDLWPVFLKVRACLRPHGLFAFTVELGARRDYQLVRERRYAHDLDYVRRVAGEAGFAVRVVREMVFRRERAEDVPSAVVILAPTD